jgi:WD40 repeat protein
LQIWDASNGAMVKDLGAGEGGTIAWSHNGKYIAFGFGDRSTNKFPIEVVNATTGEHVYTYNGHSNYVFAIAWAPDDTRIASGSDDSTVQVWQAP